MYLADKKDLEIKGKGDVCIKTPAGNQWILKNVRYIPSLKKNLISIGQLDSTGYATKLRKSSLKIMKGATVVARGSKSEILYTTAGCMNVAAVAESASNSSLWHNRLGHMSVKGMKTLAAKGVLEGLKSVDVGRCENYVMSKQKRVSFTRTAREWKKLRLEMEPYVEQGSTKQVGVELELQENSLSDVVADTHETLETTAEELDVEQGSKTTKQVGVELELQENSRSDVVADTHETPKTTTEETAVEQVTPELVLRRSSSTIRVPDMYVPSLHYLLLMKGNHNPLRRPYNWRIQPSGSKSWMMGRLGFKNALY